MGDHTETVDIDYDPLTTSYDALLKLFWNHHDSSAKCKTQYMSAIFYHDDNQKNAAEESMKRIIKERNRSVQTKMTPATDFTEAEVHHQKHLLQRHGNLLLALDIDPEDLVKSHVAARLNGYIGGFGKLAKFEEEAPKLGLNEKMIAYVHKQMTAEKHL